MLTLKELESASSGTLTATDYRNLTYRLNATQAPQSPEARIVWAGTLYRTAFQLQDRGIDEDAGIELTRAWHNFIASLVGIAGKLLEQSAIWREAENMAIVRLYRLDDVDRETLVQLTSGAITLNELRQCLGPVTDSVVATIVRLQVAELSANGSMISLTTLGYIIAAIVLDQKPEPVTAPTAPTG